MANVFLDMVLIGLLFLSPLLIIAIINQVAKWSVSGVSWPTVVAIAIGVSLLPAFYSGAAVPVWGAGLYPLTLLHFVIPGMAAACAPRKPFAVGTATLTGIYAIALAGLVAFSWKHGTLPILLRDSPILLIGFAIATAISLPGIGVGYFLFRCRDERPLQ